jgi:NADPH:quinone reductase-like Zn-dependent oxidoreductase
VRAVAFRQHGGPEVLQLVDNLPEPQPGPDEVVVRVDYAALNRLDDFVRTGWKGLSLTFPHVLGADLCGTIAGLGAEASGWSVGQRVVANPTLWCGDCGQCRAGRHNRCDRFSILGEHRDGAYAELVAIPARNLLSVPAGFSGEAAAAAPLAAVTAWHSLMVRGGICAGETVLVVGAGGGVNTMAIQLAKLTGARVMVVATCAAKVERVRNLGADWVVDACAEPDWGKAVWAATGKRGVDAVVDNVGAATWEISLRCLARGGRLLTVGGTSGYRAATPVNLLFGRHLSVVGSTMGTQDDFARVMPLVWDGRVRAIVDSVHAMERYPEALARLLSGDAFGKVVLRVGAE